MVVENEVHLFSMVGNEIYYQKREFLVYRNPVKEIEDKYLTPTSLVYSQQWSFDASSGIKLSWVVLNYPLDKHFHPLSESPELSNREVALTLKAIAELKKEAIAKLITDESLLSSLLQLEIYLTMREQLPDER